jgi:hypothetical protein
MSDQQDYDVSNDQGQFNDGQFSYLDRAYESEMAKFILDSDDIIHQKIMNYRGYFIDLETRKWIKKEQALINDVGIHYIQRQYMQFINKDVPCANLNDHNVQMLILDFSSRLRRKLLSNLRNYDIKSVSVIDEIKNDITDYSYIKLTQALNDKSRRYIFSSRRSTETLNPYPNKIESPSGGWRAKLGWQ